MIHDPAQDRERRWYLDSGERAFDGLQMTDEGVKAYRLIDGELIEIKAISQADGAEE